jgi:hypothetical protein
LFSSVIIIHAQSGGGGGGGGGDRWVRNFGKMLSYSRKQAYQGGQHIQHGRSCKLNHSLSALLELTALFSVVFEFTLTVNIQNLHNKNKLNIFK